MALRIIQADYTNPRQAEQLLYLLDQYARDPMGDGKALDPKVAAKVIDGLQQRGNTFSLLAYWDDEAVGFANCFENFSTFAAKPLINIHDLAVLEAFRGRGIAKALLQGIDAIGAERGCHKIVLEVLTYNTHAQSLYQKHGFSGKSLFWEKRL